VPFIVYPSTANSPDMTNGYIEIPVPSPQGISPAQIAQVTGFEGIDRASDSVARQFEPIAAGASWSDNPTDPDFDPYQFKVMDPMAGVLAFNPAGYSYMEYTARGRQPLVANVDYTVLDWHIIREERRIPDTVDSRADLKAKLTLRDVKESQQSMEANGLVYGGLAPDYGMNFDVMAVDIETGLWYTNDPTSLVPGTPRRALDVDYQAGIILFDPQYDIATATAPSPFAGKSFRIYYRAENDWGIQTYKSYDQYQRSYQPSLDQRQYYFEGGLVYFQKCSAGGTVAVDYAYRLNGQPQEIFASGQVEKVSDGYTGGYPLCSIDLIAKLKEAYGRNAVIDITRINRVYGVSLGVRAVWRESGRGFAAGRWRQADLQTYQTRPTEP
jgi:hypothetical protein